MKIQYAALSDVGLSRQNNEDAYLADDELGLYIVADGMGGSNAGEVASRTLCDMLHRYIKEFEGQIRSFERGDMRASNANMLELLSHGIQEANTVIFDKAKADSALSGMGTTSIAMLVAGEQTFIGHVGDSRIYLFRQGKVHQITRDHSLVEELKQLGKIQDSNEVKAKYRNAITRAVGVYETVKVDTLDLTPLPGDRFLMCSDGLYSTANEDELALLLDDVPPGEAVENLVRHANSRGGKDNITALVLDIIEVEPSQANLTQQKLETLRRVPLFKYLTFDELLKIVSIFREEHFEEGHLICQEGDPGDDLYILVEGGVVISKRGIKVTTLGPGDHFGELSLLDRHPRSADIQTTSNCFCLVLGRKKFYALVREASTLSVKMMWSLAQVASARLRQTTDDLGLARSLSVRVRMPTKPAHPFPGSPDDSEDGS